MINKLMDYIVWHFMPNNNSKFACAVRYYFMRKLENNGYYPPRYED